MSSKTSAEIRKAFLKKGFVNIRNTKHQIYAPTDENGKQIARVSTELSNDKKKEYHDSLLSDMRKQLGLDDKKQLLDLINCPLSKKEYLKILRKNGRL